MAQRIPQETIDLILRNTRIEDIVGEYQKLTKKGSRYLGYCPEHNDKHIGSFIVYPAKNCYRCFSCDAKGGAVTYLMKYANMTYPQAIQHLADKAGVSLDTNRFDYVPPKPMPAPPPMEMLILPHSMVTAREKDVMKNNFVRWLLSLPWDSAQKARALENIRDYHLGHSKYGHTIFWQIDELKRVRTGKMMKYYPTSHPKAGHRDKEAPYNYDWIHSTLARHKDENGQSTYDPPYPYPHIYNPDKQEMVQTLFGMHLLNRYPGATVNIVESEKTAVVMATAWGNTSMGIWMACGGKENLSRLRLQPIISRERNIVLWPDRDAIEEWEKHAAAIDYNRIKVNTSYIKKWWREADGEKADIADIIVRELLTNGPIGNVKTIDDVIQAAPELRPLAERLKLRLNNKDGNGE